MEIIPAIDIRGGKCVRLRQGDYNRETVFADDPVAMAQQWVDDGATRLHLVDLDGAKGDGTHNREVVRRIVQQTSIPCQLGGGVRDDEAVTSWLDDVGLDRVIIGTQAIKEPEWFRDVAARYPQRIALGLDARDSRVATDGWLTVSDISVTELAARYADLPLAAVIYTNIANDGMMQGIDDGTLNDFKQLADLGVPVIASGGVTTLDDLRQLAAISRTHPRLIGAITGRALYEGAFSLPDAIAAIATSD